MKFPDRDGVEREVRLIKWGTSTISTTRLWWSSRCRIGCCRLPQVALSHQMALVQNSGIQSSQHHNISLISGIRSRHDRHDRHVVFRHRFQGWTAWISKTLVHLKELMPIQPFGCTRPVNWGSPIEKTIRATINKCELCVLDPAIHWKSSPNRRTTKIKANFLKSSLIHYQHTQIVSYCITVYYSSMSKLSNYWYILWVLSIMFARLSRPMARSPSSTAGEGRRVVRPLLMFVGYRFLRSSFWKQLCRVLQSKNCML